MPAAGRAPWGPPGTPGGRGTAPLRAPPWYPVGSPIVPSKPDYEQPWENKPYAVPGPAVQPNLGHWFQPATSLVFVPVGTYDAVYRTTVAGAAGLVGSLVFDKCVWNSPTFDVMPQLRGSSGAAPNDAQPIWIPGSALAVQISFPAASAYTDDLLVYSLEWSAFVNSQDPEDVRPTQLPQDISTYLWDGWDVPLGPFGSAYMPTATLYFGPPPGVRFWRASLILDRITDNSGAAPLTMQVAAMLAGGP